MLGWTTISDIGNQFDHFESQKYLLIKNSSKDKLTVRECDHKLLDQHESLKCSSFECFISVPRQTHYPTKILTFSWAVIFTGDYGLNKAYSCYKHQYCRISPCVFLVSDIFFCMYLCELYDCRKICFFLYMRVVFHSSFCMIS